MFTPSFLYELRVWVLCILIVPLSISPSLSQDIDLEAYQNLKIYPNPSSEYFSISFNEIKKEVEGGVKVITVDNIVGKEVKRFAATPDNKYSLVGLKRGIYIVRIFDGQDRMIKALRLSKN